jgi:hypothetical protein
MNEMGEPIGSILVRFNIVTLVLIPPIATPTRPNQNTDQAYERNVE